VPYLETFSDSATAPPTRWSANGGGTHSFDEANDCYRRSGFGPATLWVSNQIDIENSPPLDITAVVKVAGDITAGDASDVVKLMYRLDSGPLTTVGTANALNGPTIELGTSAGLNGKWLVVYVEMTTSADNESFCLEQVIVAPTGSGGNFIPTATPTPIPTATPIPGEIPWIETFTTGIPGVQQETIGATQWSAAGGGVHGLTSSGCYQRTGNGPNTVLTTEVITLTPGVPVNISATVTSAGVLHAAGVSRDFVELWYRLDGAEVNADFAEGAFVSDTLVATGLTGSSLEVFMVMDVSDSQAFICVPQISVVKQ